jgi:L-ascorbate metabolism protein UlaG (beta-lactamase superfamily)
MDIQFYGANCVRINTKEATVVIDDNLKALGKKPVTKKDNIALFTNPNLISDDVIKNARTFIDMPGEYELSQVSILGIPAQAHTDESGEKAVIYRLAIGDIRVAVLGHIYPDLSEEKLEELGTIDILIIPVGGNGYTLDPIGATKLAKKIDPKIIIPTHYDIKGVNYEVPQQPLDEALKVLSMEPTDTTDKFKLKPNAALPESKQLIVLEPQS